MKKQYDVHDIRVASEALVAAIMRDAGGFSLETLAAMNFLCEVAGLPDDTGVDAVEDWDGSGEPRFFGDSSAANHEHN